MPDDPKNPKELPEAFRKMGLPRVTPEDITKEMEKWLAKHPDRVKELLNDPAERDR